jgi:hypothetical protein
VSSRRKGDRVTYENRQTIGLLAVMLGALVGAIGLLMFWLSERKEGAGLTLIGGALVTVGIYVIFVMDGGVPE